MVLLFMLAFYRLLTVALEAAFPACVALSLPLPNWLSNVISLAIVFLLWTAYSRWTETIRRHRELEFVIKGIGPDMIMVIDPNRRITMCNDAVEPIFGLKPRDVLGRTTDMLYFDRRVTGERHEIYDHIQMVGFHTGFAKGKHKDGRIIPLEVVTGELPQQPGAVILIRDITERKRAEDQLIEAKEAAESANSELKEMERMRDSLTHMIVHDLKSPLTAISGYLELLLRYSSEKLDDNETGFLSEASRLTSRLAEMINSLLDLRRLESNEMPMDQEVHDLQEVLRDAMKVVGPEATAKSINVMLPDRAAVVFCDRSIVRRVIVNLMSNAIKFTPENGAITVKFEAMDGLQKVLITDTGAGIPEEFHEKIFDRFAQVDVREFSTGLGLTFCKLAVEAHTGQIGVISRHAKGSTFWFTLPATPEGTTD